MTKTELNNAVGDAKEETRSALQAMYDALNQGQRKQLVKNEAVVNLFERYNVEI